MPAITIDIKTDKDKEKYQILKRDLKKALTEYCDLSKKRFQLFVGPGDKGLARANYILDELKAIGDLNSDAEQKKLEILFAAIIASEVYTSTAGRLRNLILDHVVGKSEELSFQEGANESQLKTTIEQKKNEFEARLKTHKIFTGLEKLSSYNVTDYSRILELSEGHYVCTLSFSRTEALKVVAATLQAKYAQEQQLNETILKINHVLDIKKDGAETNYVELKSM